MYVIVDVCPLGAAVDAVYWMKLFLLIKKKKADDFFLGNKKLMIGVTKQKKNWWLVRDKSLWLVRDKALAHLKFGHQL
jgi:hypothetical protein